MLVATDGCARPVPRRVGEPRPAGDQVLESTKIRQVSITACLVRVSAGERSMWTAFFGLKRIPGITVLGWDLGDPGPNQPSALPRTLSRARKMTVTTVIAGQVRHIRIYSKNNRRKPYPFPRALSPRSSPGTSSCTAAQTCARYNCRRAPPLFGFTQYCHHHYNNWRW